MEEWRDVVGYEGHYQVSNLGNVRSVGRYINRSDGNKHYRKPKEMAKTPNSDGYLTVHLSKDGVQRRIGVHILVAKAFVEGYRDGLEVNHIDFDRTNNNANNLEWLTHSENAKLTYINGRGYVQTHDIKGENNPNYGNHILSEIYKNNKEYAIEKCSRPGDQNGRARAIRMITPDGNTKEFSYMAECAKYLIDKEIVRSKHPYTIAAKISAAAKNNTPYFKHHYEFI